ncbi:MAG: FHA domain-containing protein, partial [Myxococcales bacterium]|nr:FHA domain-containing protein [Myxococcales bacterium]
MIRISLSEEGKPPRLMTFELPAVSIGRREGNDLRLQTAGISSNHCKISRVGNGFQLEDLGSTNGTYLNRRKVLQAVPLQPGDEIVVARWTLRVLPDEGQQAGARPLAQPIVNAAGGPPGMGMQGPPGM